MTAPRYHKPDKHIHRGFYYLDDETVINSLSAVEAGKIDEVVAKVNSAREGGFGGGLGVQGVKAEGSRKSTSSFEEEIVRTRTRFSVFELWYQNLITSKGLGRFTGWGPDILADVEPGDTVELKARLEAVPLQGLFRLFLWFATQAQTQGTFFSQKGEELKATKEAERNIKLLMGEHAREELLIIATPEGEEGPAVVIPLAQHWMIGQLGHLSGRYSVVAQVDQVLGPGEEFPTMRLTRDAPPIQPELDAFREVVSGFVEPAQQMGITVSPNDASIVGPALWLKPIAIFR
jgi:hypothetical protein